MSTTLGFIVIGIAYLVLFALLIPAIAVSVRRMHDVGKSGWFMLIPIYNFILTVSEGDSGPNEYGDDPKGRINVDEFGVKEKFND